MEDTTSVRIVVIGGAGNVGKGICQACSNHSEWHVIGVDPNFREASVPANVNVIKINSAIEDVGVKEFQSWFIAEQRMKHLHVEFIVTNDDGNRENYAHDPKLGFHNDARFKSLIKRIATTKLDSNRLECDRADNINVSVHVSYIGGSWTRLQSKPNLVVDDSSCIKEGGGSSPYEIAKTSAEINARRVSAKHAIALTFYDYISVVPNFNSNFSVNRMVRSGLEHGVIKFSPGDYGRPLLYASKAGEFVANQVEKQIHCYYDRNTEDDETSYETVLVPGNFVSFQTFANIAKEVIEQNCDGRSIAFETYEQTPDELRTRCISSREFVSDTSSVIRGLKEAAMYSLKHYFKDMRK